MTRTVYLVRLRRAFSCWYDGESNESRTVSNPNIRVFATREQAEAFSLTNAPVHSPFDVDAIEWMSPDAPFGKVTLEQWMGVESKATFGVYCQPDETVSPEAVDEYGEFEEQRIEDRTVTEAELREAIREAGLPAPWTRTVARDDWRSWWKTTLLIMSDAQRAAIWHVFVGNPFLILQLEAEV